MDQGLNKLIIYYEYTTFSSNNKRKLSGKRFFDALVDFRT